MRRLAIVSVASVLILSGLTVGVRAGGRFAEYPFRFSQRAVLPIDPPFESLFPEALGAFKRQTIIQPILQIPQRRLEAWGAATYARPGEAEYVYVELRLYTSEQIAALLINPSDWRIHSRTADKYFDADAPRPYVFTNTHNGYRNYSLEYVSGRWNVTIRSVNDLDSLIAFANVYPY